MGRDVGSFSCRRLSSPQLPSDGGPCWRSCAGCRGGGRAAQWRGPGSSCSWSGGGQGFRSGHSCHRPPPPVDEVLVLILSISSSAMAASRPDSPGSWFQISLQIRIWQLPDSQIHLLERGGVSPPEAGVSFAPKGQPLQASSSSVGAAEPAELSLPWCSWAVGRLTA